MHVSKRACMDNESEWLIKDYINHVFARIVMLFLSSQDTVIWHRIWKNKEPSIVARNWLPRTMLQLTLPIQCRQKLQMTMWQLLCTFAHMWSSHFNCQTWYKTLYRSCHWRLHELAQKYLNNCWKSCQEWCGYCTNVCECLLLPITMWMPLWPLMMWRLLLPALKDPACCLCYQGQCGDCHCQ